MSLLRGEPALTLHKGRYYVIFYDRETKRQKWHSLGTKRKDIAQPRYRQIVRAAESGEFDPLRERYEFGALTVEAAAERFQKERSRGSAKKRPWSDRTRKDYEDFLAHFCRTIPAGCALSQLTAADCRKMIAKPSTPDGQAGYYRRLRSFLNWCVQKRLISTSPLESVAEPVTVRRDPEFFTREQLRRIVEKIHADSWRGEGRDYEVVRLERIVRFDVATGLRLSELCRLRWRDVDEGSQRIKVIGKGKKGRSVPIFAGAAEVLREIREEYRGKFDANPPGTLEVFAGMPYHETSKAFKASLRALGFDEEFSFHSLRKTFASWLVMDGVDIYTVSNWLGHSSVVVTERAYAYLKPDHVPEAAKRTFGGSYIGHSLDSTSKSRLREARLRRLKSLRRK